MGKKRELDVVLADLDAQITVLQMAKSVILNAKAKSQMARKITKVKARHAQPITVKGVADDLALPLVR